MALADYEELAARSFEEPHDPELRAAMAVCADDLAQSGDPRGALITMEHALDGADHRRAKELRAAMHAYAIDHGGELLGGSLATLLHAKRTLSLEWRSGRLYGISVDARYLPDKAKLSPGELVARVLKPPAAAHLRRLRVRVRALDAVADITAMLGKRTHPSLEEIELASTVWPQRISPMSYLERPYFTALRGGYPNLWYFATRDWILSLPLAETQTVDETVEDVLLGDDPQTPEGRRLLGRALTSEHDKLRLAALERITRLGPAAIAFARVLTILLQPRVTTPQAPIVAALRALGPSHAHALVLAKVSSRAADYDAETRKAAGVAAAAVRPR